MGTAWNVIGCLQRTKFVLLRGKLMPRSTTIWFLVFGFWKFCLFTHHGRLPLPPLRLVVVVTGENIHNSKKPILPPLLMRDFRKVRFRNLLIRKKGVRSIIWVSAHSFGKNRIETKSMFWLARETSDFPTDWITWISLRRFLLYVGAGGGSLQVGTNYNQTNKSQPSTNSWTIKGTTL